MKPEELDVVRLLRPLPQHDLAAGSQGTVVMHYARYSESDSAPAYEVEFADTGGVTQALITLCGADLGSGMASSSGHPTGQLTTQRELFMPNSYELARTRR